MNRGDKMSRKKTEEVRVDDDLSDDVAEYEVVKEYKEHKNFIVGYAVLPIIDGKVSAMPKAAKALRESGYIK